MNILYLVPHVPNATKARSYFQIRGLSEAGHKVTIATIARNRKDLAHIKHLEQSGVSVLYAFSNRLEIALNCVSAVLSLRPLQANFAWSPRLEQSIAHFLRESPPDIIHIEHLRMAKYGLQLIKDWPVIWDAVDHLSSLYEQTTTKSTNRLWRLIAAYEAPRLRSYENWLVGKFPSTLVISRHDQHLFQTEGYEERIQIAPLGLPLAESSDSLQRSATTLIITGALNYQPNVASIHYFVREIFPIIVERLPDIRLQLVGANPDPTIQALRSAHIEVTGFVPSVLDYLRQSTVALAPILYGTGTQIKVLEAFLTATPLVATSIALRGLDVTNSDQVLIADTATEFADATIRLLSNDQLRNEIGVSGRRYVEQYHDLMKTTQNLVHIYDMVISAKKVLING